MSEMQKKISEFK